MEVRQNLVRMPMNAENWQHNWFLARGKSAVEERFAHIFRTRLFAETSPLKVNSFPSYSLRSSPSAALHTKAEMQKRARESAFQFLWL